MIEVPRDRLGTTDKKGDRVYIYPADVKGFWRKNRNWTQIILIVIFLILPWLKINGSQALLLNIGKREFAFFGLTFFANDGPLLFFIFAMLTLGLALVTAVWGRIWCGWGCPQTVFIDGVFRRIERFIEGDHLHQRKLASESWSINKAIKKTIKWLVFFLISTLIAHSLIAYFVGAEELLAMTSHLPAENWTDFLIVSFVTGLVLFDFGWFREQFCFIVCPYGRFQSILMDNNSTAVMYDEGRGEPRKSPELPKDKQGDCVNCLRCVMVCPTGIDIRRGIQMECINCTACIDACDEIMEKVNRPKGLIRYSSLTEMIDKSKKSFWSFRTILYVVLILAAFFTLTFKIVTRADLHMVLLRAKGAPYRLLTGVEEGYIMNQFNAHVRNQSHYEMRIHFQIVDNDNANPIQLIEQEKELVLKPGEIKSHLMFVKFPARLANGVGQKLFKLEATYDNNQKIDADLKILAPF
jgi:cytochrome c oxidase accessory protein FixG